MKSAGLCPDCKARREKEREANPERQAKKRRLYGNDYKKKAKQIRDTATHCYLCGGAFLEGEPIQADHLFPELGKKSPLGGTHPHCNRKKSNTPYSPTNNNNNTTNTTNNNTTKPRKKT